MEVKSDHLHSESSDSFVCVSEDLPNSDRSRTSPDGNGGGGEWEYLKMEEEEGEGGGSSEGGDLTVTPVKRDGGGGEKGAGEEKEGSESSDWESWDD